MIRTIRSLLINEKTNSTRTPNRYRSDCLQITVGTEKADNVSGLQLKVIYQSICNHLR